RLRSLKGLAFGPVAYRLRLPEELSGVHDTFHVSNLKKCLADASLHVPLDEIKVDKTLRFVEEPVENSVREVKRLKCSRMVVVKFLFDELQDRVVNDVVTQLKVLTSLLDDGRGSGSWMFLFNSKRGPEFTWEREDYMKSEYPQLFVSQTERDHLNGIGFVLDFVEFISFTFGDKEMISVIEAVSR
ncbi:hypothetical protein Tco_1451581, partial [Tanacetum coccineum]